MSNIEEGERKAVNEEEGARREAEEGKSHRLICLGKKRIRRRRDGLFDHESSPALCPRLMTYVVHLDRSL